VKRTRHLSAAAVAAAVLVALGTGVVSAWAGDGAGPGSNAIVGSWLVNVDRPGLGPLKSLQTFTRGRGVIEIANGGATVRSPGHGAWRRVGGRQYETTHVFFRYDPAQGGAFVGTVKIRHVLELSRDGSSFTGVAVAELRDAAGNLLPGSNTRRDVVTGERIVVESIPG
jgi:hypothetical protein